MGKMLDETRHLDGPLTRASNLSALVEHSRQLERELSTAAERIAELSHDLTEVRADNKFASEALNTYSERIAQLERESGALEGVAETIKSASEAYVVSRNAVIDECAKVALADTCAPGPDWTKMAPEWKTKPEMFKIGYAYASGCSEQADDIHERIIALKDGSEYVDGPSALYVAARSLLAACAMEAHNEAIFTGKWKKGSKAWNGDFVAKQKAHAMECVKSLTRNTPGAPNRDVSAGTSHSDPDGSASKPGTASSQAGATQGAGPILDGDVSQDGQPK